MPFDSLAKRCRLEVAADAPLPVAGDLRQLRQVEALCVHPVFQRRGLACCDARPRRFGLLADEIERLQRDGLVHLAATRRHDHHAAILVLRIHGAAVAAHGAVAFLRHLIDIHQTASRKMKPLEKRPLSGMYISSFCPFLIRPERNSSSSMM